MIMLEIVVLDNGAHRNQTYHGNLPDGWALLREDPKTLENFPFGNFSTEDIDGVLYVAADSWEPLPMPDPDPTTEPDPEPSLEEQVAELTRLVNILAGGEQ